MVNNIESDKLFRLLDNETTEEWSDEMCIRISLEDDFPAIVKDTTIQKVIINRFLNFYLSGKVQKGLNARDIIFAVIAIIPYSLGTEDVIWHKNHYSDNGNLFFLTPEDKLKMEIKNILTQQQKPKDDQLERNNNIQNNETKTSESSSINDFNKENEKCSDCDTSGTHVQENDIVDDKKSTVNENNDTNENTSDDIESSPLKTLVWFRKKAVNRQPICIENIEYGAAENAAFCISCNKLLDQWDDVAARIYLKYFFGFAALSLMRTVAKSYQHVIKMFLNTFPRTVAFSTDRINYSPPSNACVTKSFKTFRRLERKTQIMFAKLVINSFMLNYRARNETHLSELSNTGGVTNMLRVTVLSHLSYYGMEIINMLQEIASRTSCFSTVFESLCTTETASSWNKVNDFFKKYMFESARQRTFHWARVIDRKQFKYLSCENNYELAVVIAVFVEKLTSNGGIWNARWVKSGNNLETYKELGRKMYEDFLSVRNLSYSLLDCEEILNELKYILK
ncbi:uncharacterized protein LOC126776058 [Nymphalis io]|uniref:uncharacterized protein LOC126776058 n=1 Tax=Inachis io TaxID=171585 RepID=UPI002169191F|nr:uncharacterized protein LOC126776058 [Nymphalis io]